jgi:hypothetical protein
MFWNMPFISCYQTEVGEIQSLHRLHLSERGQVEGQTNGIVVSGPLTVKTELATHILCADDNTEKLELLTVSCSSRGCT